MKRLKKALRLIWLIVLIILACFGIGFGGTPPVLPVIKYKYTTEFALAKEEDENEEDEELKLS